jgi:hypothetical protein
MSWLKGLTDSLGLTSTGPSAATLEQIKTAPVGTQSLYEQRVNSFDDDLAQAFKPLVRGWQPGQAPLTQEQYDRIQSASLDLFDKLGYTNPMGSQPSRMVAASMRKAVRPPPKSYAEAKTPTATEVSFQHASPHKFTNVDEVNPFGQFSEAYLLKGEGATVYGPGAAYVSTAEPTHRHYLKSFKNNLEPDYLQPQIENALGPIPREIFNKMAFDTPDNIKVSLPQAENALHARNLQSERLIQNYTRRLAQPGLPANQQQKFQEALAYEQNALRETAENFAYLEKLKSFDLTQLKGQEGPYSYRGTIAEDPARTVLFDKPLSEQLPEVQAALARSSSQARRTLGKAGAEGKTQLNLLPAQQQAALIEHFNIRGDRSHSAWNKYMQLASSNPQVLLREANLSPLAREAVEALIAQKKPNQLQDIFANTGPPAGDYIKDYRASPKTVQRLRDAGIDLVRYTGDSQSPNYVVVNPAAAKIQSRTPSIAATFGTGELARQLYESIYGKEAQ